MCCCDQLNPPVFAVVHTTEMLTALKKKYYAAWYNEKQTNAPGSADADR
jgi:hypothetical protein